jgi:hypothetical protein
VFVEQGFEFVKSVKESADRCFNSVVADFGDVFNCLGKVSPSQWLASQPNTHSHSNPLLRLICDLSTRNNHKQGQSRMQGSVVPDSSWLRLLQN